MNQRKINASVFIITKNEESNILRCLQSVSDFAEIIVVDSGSIDRTVEIADNFGAKVILNSWPGFAKQKQFALDQCTQEFVLNLDADEEISPEAVGFIRIKVAGNDLRFDGIEFTMYNYFCGKKPHKYSAQMHKIRFARRKNAYYDTKKLVHESINVSGNVVKCSHPIYHYGENNIHNLVAKINEYSALRAKSSGKITFLIIPRAILSFLFFFIKIYILKRNFLNGNRGFISSFISSFYAFLKVVKRLHD